MGRYLILAKQAPNRNAVSETTLPPAIIKPTAPPPTELYDFFREAFAEGSFEFAPSERFPVKSILTYQTDADFLFEEFVNWCRAKSIPSLRKETFERLILTLFPNADMQQSIRGSMRERIWRGIRYVKTREARTRPPTNQNRNTVKQ